MPSPTTGSSSWLQLKAEKTGYQTGPSTATIDLPFISSGLKPAGEEFASDPSLGGMAPKDPLTKLKRGEGDMEFALRYEGFDNFWLAFLGHMDEENLDTDVVERYYYPQSDFTTWIDDADVEAEGYRSFTGLLVVPDGVSEGYDMLGMQIASLSFGISNEALRVTPTWLTQPMIKGGAVPPPAPTFPLSPLILGGGSVGAKVRMMDRGAHDPWVPGDDFACVTDGTVAIDIPHTSDRECVGSFAMKEPVLNGDMTIGITLNREQTDLDLIDKWNADTPQELSILYTGPSAGAQAFQFELYFPYCLISNVGPDISDAGVNQESITLTAYQDTDTSDQSSGGRGGDTATARRATNMWLRTVNNVLVGEVEIA